MQAEDNERLGHEALGLFLQILLDYVATLGDDDPIDTRIAVEEYLGARSTEVHDEAIVTRLRALAEAVREIVWLSSGGL